jgi:Ca2+-binding EF-hand superfamily protein
MFDQKNDDKCYYREFVDVLKGPLSEIRKKLCLLVFNQLDRKKKSYLEFEDVLCIFSSQTRFILKVTLMQNPILMLKITVEVRRKF